MTVQVGVGGTGDGKGGAGDEEDDLHHLSPTSSLGGYNQGEHSLIMILLVMWQFSSFDPLTNRSIYKKEEAHYDMVVLS